jgi:hypothetical protein
MNTLYKITSSKWWYIGWVAYCVIAAIVWPSFWTGLALGLWFLLAADKLVPMYWDWKYDRELDRRLQEVADRYPTLDFSQNNNTKEP